MSNSRRSMSRAAQLRSIAQNEVDQALLHPDDQDDSWTDEILGDSARALRPD
jgi:hypothetical protein